MTKGRSMRYASLNDMPQSMRKLAESKLQKIESLQVPKPSKYNNSPTTVDGIRFDSKKEANYYKQLKIRVELGEVSHFFMQVPIRLPDGTKYILDFLEFYHAEKEQYVDVKGVETSVFKLKKRAVEHHYPIRIKVV